MLIQQEMDRGVGTFEEELMHPQSREQLDPSLWQVHPADHQGYFEVTEPIDRIRVFVANN
jgi:hypothetical protein